MSSPNRNDPGSAAASTSRNRWVESSPSRLPETPRRPRLQHLRDRISSPPSGSRSRSDADEGSDASASSRRPRLRHRFSRSLTSLAAARTESDQVGRADDEKCPLAKWRARSKAKLVRAFTPTLDDRSGPSFSALSDSPRAVLDAPVPGFGNSEARTPSRNRSHSAPLLLARSTELVAPAPVSAHRLSVLAAPRSPQASVPPGGTLESPPQSPFHTCPSSPWADTPFVFSNADLFSDLSASPDGIFQAAADLQRKATARKCITELPREIQLEVFRALLVVCEEDWRRAIREEEWIGEVACQRWSDGRAKGRREIVKLGRVCKLWRDLSLDGQLWSDAPSATYLGPDSLPAESVDRLATKAGSFLTSLDARGLGSSLDWKTLIRIVETAQVTNGHGATRLSKIDLTGCTALTAASLANLLSHSPLLAELHAPGLRCVNEGHMRVLGSDCPRLAVLDVSRCACLAAAALLHLHYPPPRHPMEGASPSGGASPGGLRTLKAAGLSGMSDFVVGAMLERHSGLETLDVSFSRLHDDAMQRFVSLPATGSDAPASTRPSQTRPPPPASADKRCFPALRHLSLTGCTSLTSSGLGHLTGAIPNVEILEIARFGVRARTAGIARLLASCPKLRRIDLEDNHELGDDAILALVPSGTSRGAPDLEHLIISACPALRDDAIASVATNSPKLRVLEADGTAISDRTARLFIRLAQGRAITAQAVAASREEHSDPLVGVRYPAILSVLDNRTTGRRLSRDIGAKHLRPRDGQRGYWTRAIGDYHDDPPPSGDETVSGARRKDGSSLGECDPTRVVVRSFHSSLAVDAADAARRALASAPTSDAANESKLGAMRLRSLSDSEVFRRGSSYPHDDNARTGCIIS